MKSLKSSFAKLVKVARTTASVRVIYFVVQNVEQSSADRFAKYSFGFTLNTYIFHI